MIDYLELSLLIDRTDGQFRVRVLDSPPDLKPEEAVELEIDSVDLQASLTVLRNALDVRRDIATDDDEHEHADEGPEPSDPHELAKKLGTLLFQTAFHGAVLACYDLSVDHARRSRTELRIKLEFADPSVARLPWELMYDPRKSEFVAHRRPIVRNVRRSEVTGVLENVGAPLRILGMVAAPRDLTKLNHDLEVGYVNDALQPLIASGDVVLHWVEGGTLRDLEEVLRKRGPANGDDKSHGHGPWHIFHFIGHGGYDEERAMGFLALEPEPGARQHYKLYADDLATKLATNQAALRLVLLNSCDGATNDGNSFSSAAETLARQGIGGVLAMQALIEDHAAIEFAQTFYSSVVDRLAVDAAATEARTALKRVQGLAWAKPALYLSADPRLFPGPKPLTKVQRIARAGLAAGVTLLLMAACSWRVPVASADIDLVIDELSFVSTAEQSLLNRPIVARAADLRGGQIAIGARSGMGEERVLPTPRMSPYWTIVSDDEAAVTVDVTDLRVGSVAALRRTPEGLELGFKGAVPRVSVGTTSLAHVVWSVPPRSFDSASITEDSTVRSVQPSQGVEVSASDFESVVFGSSLGVQRLLPSAEGHPDSVFAPFESNSVSGTVTTWGGPRPIGNGEELLVESDPRDTEARITGLRYEDGAFHLKFEGKMRRIRHNDDNLMPCVLRLLRVPSLLPCWGGR